MEKQKRWQLALIVVVVALTLYNILPTIIYYSKPLKEPIDQKKAEAITKETMARVNSLETDSVEWLEVFCSHLFIKPQSITLLSDEPSTIKVQFADSKQAQIFKKFLPKAGNAISFAPAQLTLVEDSSGDNIVFVRRHIPIHFAPDDSNLFTYTNKETQDHKIAPLYFECILDRFSALTEACNESLNSQRSVQQLQEDSGEDEMRDLIRQIHLIKDVFGENSPLATRFFQTFSHGKNEPITSFLERIENEKKKIEFRLSSLKTEGNDIQEGSQKELIEYLGSQVRTFEEVISLIKKKQTVFASGTPSYTTEEVRDIIRKQYTHNDSSSSIYTLEMDSRHPLIKTLSIDWAKDAFVFELHPDVEKILQTTSTTEQLRIQQEELHRLIVNMGAVISQKTEEIVSQQGALQVALSRLPSSEGMIIMHLEEVGAKVAEKVREEIQKEWNPTHQDLISEKFPLLDSTSYTNAPYDQQNVCLVVVGPHDAAKLFPELKEKAVYVVLRGAQAIADQYRKFPDTDEAKVFQAQLQELAVLLQKDGFVGYSGAHFGAQSSLVKDVIFELPDYYSSLLKATRENFYVVGSKNYALLELSDVEQRIITENRIDNAIQEDLLRSKEAYQGAQVDLDPLAHYSVPPPTKNVYWENLKRNVRSYFRGDDSRVIRWGLDLSGGKSVRVALLDHANRSVKNRDDLNQAVNELYTRINNMGVAERTIRIENDTIAIDFPGSQAFNASELVKASSMYFHVVNEQFGPLNQALRKEVYEFLQEVWNEATLTNRKSIEEINEIAFEKLKRAESRSESFGPKDSARQLLEKGLRLADLRHTTMTAAFDDSTSMIARMQGDNPADWHFQTHPLMIIFHNFALDGASLENVQTGYDPSKGNTLLFGVKSSGARKEAISPRDAFTAWTEQFCEEKIGGTPKEAYSQGRGWRMAVVLNGQVISAPALHSPLRDHAMISGNFSQREVARLATDLKAGSLTFTPKILSEENVSPELGLKERQDGIIAAVIAVIGVIALMVSYYRFAGVVAVVAVLFNVLVMWAVMQNIGYALTLPAIAGLVLTVGMAVDANVLVFERIREEFRISQRIKTAIASGYRRAFSAIIDSNLTTILAALILIQFDCGPIRGFAVALIIGIVASMFTALFMTRYFFAGWVQKPENKELKMSEWIVNPRFDFLKMARPVIITSVILFMAGVAVLATEWRSIFGMDFTGGYSLVVTVADNGGTPRDMASTALVNKGLAAQDFQIRELGRPQLLRIQLAKALDEPGRPFYAMSQLSSDELQTNPRIQWVVDALQDGGVHVKASTHAELEKTWMSISGQFSESMRINAFTALSLALLGVLIYIAFRFEWKYAVSAVVALLHDVLLTVAVIALAHKMGLSIQIDLQVIGAIMTIIGYSLNDTIIVFDRIREDLAAGRKKTFAEIITIALNATLSRTVMTSGTTLIVLIALVVFGGTSIFAFSFVMLIGVFLGTLSSLFIASSVLLWLESKERSVVYAT